MAVALVSSTASAGTGTTTTCAVTITATTAGTILVLSIAADSASVTGISGGSGTFSQAANSNNAHNLDKIWIGTGVSAGTTSLTVTFGGTTNSGVQVLEFSGLAAAPIDASVAADGVSVSPSAGPVTPTTNDNVIVAAMVDNVSVSSGPTGGFTGLTAYNWVGSRRLATGYKIQTSATAGTAGWTISSSANWDEVIVALKGSATGGPGTSAVTFGWSTAGTGTVSGATSIVSTPYGSANLDTKANVHIGPSDSVMLGQKFLSHYTSSVTSVRFSQRWGPGGYSGGTGGTIQVGIQADNNGVPSGTYLGSATFVPGNPGANTTYTNFTMSPAVPTVAGTRYWVVYRNLDAAPAVNYISVNEIFIYGTAPVPHQPLFADNDFGDWFFTGGQWVAHGKYTPVVDITYANGGHDGQGYIGMIGISGGVDYQNITGTTTMVREQFTVSGGSRTVTGAFVRVRRTSGTDALLLTLEDSGGTSIDTVSIAAASIPISAPGGDNGGSAWGGGSFSAPRTLTNGSSYRLRLSCAGTSVYTMAEILTGQAVGFDPSLVFSDGTGQFTTNSGSTWTDMYTSQRVDIQFYFPVTVPASGFTGTSDVTFGWTTNAVGTVSSGITGTSAVTFGWGTAATGTVTNPAGTGVGETVILYTPGDGGRGHAYNRFISTAAGAVHAADEGLFIPAEHYLASYTALANNISIATANAHVLQVMASASLNLRIRRIFIMQATAASTAAVGIMEIWRLTTAGTGGSSVTPAKDDGGDAASGATAQTLPSAKGTEGTLLFRPALLWRQTSPTTGAIDTFWEWTPNPYMKPVVVPAGTANGIAIKNVTAIAAGTVNAWIEFTETLWT